MKREHRADLHLTIAFFGNITEERAQAVFASVATEPTAASARITSRAPLGAVIAAIVGSPSLAAFISAIAMRFVTLPPSRATIAHHFRT